MLRRVLAAALLVIAATATARDLPAELRRHAAVTGGARWNGVEAIRSSGSLSLGGLDGDFDQIDDKRSGRFRNDYRLGPMSGADGHDGERPWRKDPGGEVVLPDAGEALQRARTAVWMTRNGLHSPDGVRYAPAETREHDGGTYTVIEAQPDGGLPIALWLDPRTGLLARTTMRDGQDTVVTTFSDHRDVDGLKIPFRVQVDRADPRNRVVSQVKEAKLVTMPADASFAAPAATADQARIVGGARETTLPFDLINNHIYVDARVDGKPVRMLVDTGGVNLLTPAAAKRLGLDARGRMAARGVGEKQVDLGFAKAQRIEVGSVRLDAPIFYVIDLNELEPVEGLRFDGLVGFELFHRFVVRIDYAARRLTLTDPSFFRAPEDATAIPFELEERIPLVKGAIDGRPATFSIDTGARSSLSLHAPFVREHDLAAHYAPRFETIGGWGVGGPSRGWPVRVGEVRLGDAVVKDLVADLAKTESGAFADPKNSANVGSGLLRRFVVTFDYDRRRMYLQPGADHAKRDTYDRLGAWLMLDGEAMRIAALVPDGPAQQAGLRVDDRILAVDGAPVSTRSLSDWRIAFKESPAGTKLRLSTKRRGDVREVDATLRELLPEPDSSAASDRGSPATPLPRKK